ncbi:MAG: ABC transporter permease [Tenericutes bacterium]|nr:ABC transporter permease [Mycoplasmatota bacterium]
MSRFLILVKGELQRLNKYNVTTISFVVALLWFLLLYFIDDMDILATMLPFVIIVDATMMSIIFIGTVMFYEKTESTFSTMLVTPVSNQELILSKAVANTIHNLFSSILIILVFHFVKGVEVNWVFIIIALVLSIFFHSLLGFVFSFHSKDFTSMLVGVMIYSFVFLIPSALNFFGLIFKGAVWEHILLIAPTQSATKLIEVGFGADISAKAIIAFVLLLGGSILGYKYYILPKFKTYAVKQSGV